MNERGAGVASVLVVVILGVMLAMITAAGMTVWLLGTERLFVLALILVCGLVVVGVILAAGVVVRQYRRNDAPPVIERHFHHDGTRTIEKVIDSRPIAALPQWQTPQLPAYGAFPELLRAAYQAGALPTRDAVDAEVREAGEEWGGEIRRSP